MLRVKDPEKSLKFYQEVLGMEFLKMIEHQEAGFNLYYIGYMNTKTTAAQAIPHHEGLLQLTWEYGSEKQENFKYHNGNEQPQGFGHICE